ncbi:MAG: PAS domain-containing protein [Desulfobulbaceae bacterium]|nr:PAS domain-containing protein [Desulfobulbaceae bacterium]
MTQKEVKFAPKLIGDLLDIIHNAILVIDSDNKIIFANSRTAKMFQTTVSHLQGMDIIDLFMPDDLSILVPNILDITRTSGEFEGEAMLQRPDGTSFLGMIAVTYFLWDNHKEGMAFTIHDITDIKSIEYALRRSERTAFLGRLVDDISHQIRNPVTVIGGFARRLIKDCDSQAKAKAIMKEANHLEALLDTLNNFIRLPRPHPTRTSMGSIIDNMEKRLQKQVTDLGCNWFGDYEENIRNYTFLVDQELLMVALESVVINACESYTESDSAKNVTVQVKLSKNSNLPYVIKIIDQGVGISQSHLRHVFAHFHSNKTKHIGMGLTFAQRIVEEQMGKIIIESFEGKGTTVSCYLIQDRRRIIRTMRLE